MSTPCEKCFVNHELILEFELLSQKHEVENLVTEENLSSVVKDVLV